MMALAAVRNVAGAKAGDRCFWVVTCLYLAAAWVRSAWFATHAMDLLPAFGTTVHSAATLARDRPLLFRLLTLCVQAVWLAFFVWIDSWAGYAQVALVGGSVFVALWRFERKPST